MTKAIIKLKKLNLAVFFGVCAVNVAMCLFVSGGEFQEDSIPPARREFEELNRKIVDSISGESKDYKSAYGLMVEFCRKYPATTSARFVAHNASMWEEAGFITKEEFAVIAGLLQEADPAGQEMNKIKPELEKAMMSNDKNSLVGIADQLEEIIRGFPNTQSSYNAASALPDIYRAIGEIEKSIAAGESFLKNYPVDKTDQSGHENRTVGILLNRATYAKQSEKPEMVEQLLDLIEKDIARGSRYIEVARLIMRIMENNVMPRELEERVIAKLTKDYDVSVIKGNFPRHPNGEFQAAEPPYRTQEWVADYCRWKYKDYVKAKEIYNKLQKDFPDEKSITQRYNQIIQEEQERKKKRGPTVIPPEEVIDVDKYAGKEQVSGVLEDGSISVVRLILFVSGLVLIVCASILIMLLYKKANLK
ncbi:MAG: hypothetical protein LBJ00_02655 [Planctomycetaceae bacterium]|jgi:tetratricopeptide (TPR) repeat protein|nr:hypothetical protein [Planctomycetaceae bacterium]